MIALSEDRFFTPENYLELEEASAVKHEYINGKVYAMAGTTDVHNTTALNFALLIRSRLRGTNCRIYFTDSKVRLEHCNCFYYPDIFVTCEAKDRETTTYKCFPKLIIEVLSESTEAFDRGDKFNDYQTLTSLEEYVLVNTKNQRVEIFRRNEQGGWHFQTHTPNCASFPLATLNLSVAFDELYADVSFEQESTIPPEN
jgi:Uma2 family endonuclease